jgi:pimeloyl-ACP methyl ester carboxylesterase
MPVFKEINFQRRRFFSQAALTIAATQLGMLGSASALSSKETGAKVPAVEAATKAGTHTSFDSLKQIDAGLLNVGYAEAGPANGTAVVLLHGWPYDIYSYVDVAPLLASAGYRVIVPYLRGYGSTRFLSSETCRNGQQSVVALDIVALMDALKIQKAVIAGFDWGARTADIMAVLFPDRCKAIVSVGGYLIGSCRRGPSWPGGTSFTLPQNAANLATARTRGILTSLFGRPLRRSGSSMTPRTIARQRRSVTPIMWRSRFIITAGGWAWPKARKSMTTWKRGWPGVRSSLCPRSLSTETQTAHRTHPPQRIAINSPASMMPGSSRAAWATICRKKLRKPSHTPLSTSTDSDSKRERARVP